MFLLPVPAQAEAQDTAVQDIFIGMVVPDGDGLVLERCSIGKPRYLLRAAEGAGDPFGVLQGMGDKVQAQVIARYRADGEVHILEVTSIEGMKPGKSCHLLDVIDESLSMVGAEAGAEVGAGANADGDRWEGLAAGTAAMPDTETVGSGEYAYRFVLVHARTGKPSPHTDFALSVSRKTDYELPFVTDEKKVFQGRTDAEGRTPVFRLPVRMPDSAFDLRERFGSGPFGETFHLTDHNGQDLFNAPYLLITCTNPPRHFRGYTYPNGDTAYAASDGRINIQLRVLDDIGESLPSSCADGMSEEGDHVVLPTASGKGME